MRENERGRQGGGRERREVFNKEEAKPFEPEKGFFLQRNKEKCRQQRKRAIDQLVNSTNVMDECRAYLGLNLR